MGGSAAISSLARVVRESGVVEFGSAGVVLISGGADSAAVAAGLSEVASRAPIALHLNYRLREGSDADEAIARELCERLGLELVVERPELAPGNVQAAARDARYAAAERVRSEGGLDWVATGHTRTDLAETVIYRLATSPGRRALLALRARHGAVIRPLLGLTREQVRELAMEAELPFCDDPSNAEPVYARNRIRGEVLPVMRDLSPSAEDVIAETQAELAEESDVLERMAREHLDREGAAAAVAIPRDALAELHPALRRIALRQLAEQVAGRQVPLGRARAAEIARLAEKPEGGVVELGDGVEAHVEHGHVRFAAGSATPAAETTLTIPGSCRLGSWELRAGLEAAGHPTPDSDLALLDPATLDPPLVVRTWQQGDRIRPLGLGGTKSLQDLFTDRKIPRSLRHELPVVLSGDEVAWIAGVAVSERFAAAPDAGEVAMLSASLARS